MAGGLALGALTSWTWWQWGSLALLTFLLARRREWAIPLTLFLLAAWYAPQHPRLQTHEPLDLGHPYPIRAVVNQRQDRGSSIDFILEVEPARSHSIRRILWRAAITQPGDSSVAPPYAPGDTVKIVSRLRWPRGRRNPHGFDEQTYLWTRTIDARTVGPVQIVDWHPAAGPTLGRTLWDLRQGITGRLQAWTGDQAPLARALLLGDRGGLDAEFQAQARLIGVAHVLAVSGLHVGFIAALLLGIFKLLPIPAGVRATFVILMLVGYVALTGSPPSVDRAVIMASLYLWGRSIRRSVNPWNMLAAAALISLLLDPRSLFTPGFQLSFAAVAGIIAFYPRIRAALAATATGTFMLDRHPLRFLTGLMIMTIAAQLGSLPVVLHWFYQLPLLGILANLLVVPLAGLAITSASVALLLDPLLPALAGLAGSLAGLFLAGMQWIVAALAAGPVPLMITGRPPVWVTVAMAAILVALPAILRMQPGRRAFRLALLALLPFTLWAWQGALRSPRLEITVLDVGQGDAIHVALPDGRHLLLDAGPRQEEWDAGRMIVLPYLTAAGVSTLELAIISHPHADHAGGLEALLEGLRIRAIRQPPMTVGGTLYDQALAVAAQQGVPVQAWVAGDRLQLGAVELQILAPDSLLAGNLGANEGSLVIKLSYGETSLLLTGDIERQAERRLLAYGQVLASDWLKTAHHGGASSSSRALLEMIQPARAVVSVGRYNPYRHPDPGALGRLAASGATVYRTDQAGAITLISDGKRWEVVTQVAGKGASE